MAIMPSVTNELRLLRLTDPDVPHDRLTDDQRNQLWHCASERNLRFYHANSNTVPNQLIIRQNISECASGRGWRLVDADYEAIMPSVINELRLLRLTTNPD